MKEIWFLSKSSKTRQVQRINDISTLLLRVEVYTFLHRTTQTDATLFQVTCPATDLQSSLAAKTFCIIILVQRCQIWQKCQSFHKNIQKMQKKLAEKSNVPHLWLIQIKRDNDPKHWQHSKVHIFLLMMKTLTKMSRWQAHICNPFIREAELCIWRQK